VDASGPKVLYVDRAGQESDALVRALEDQGYTLMRVGDARAALLAIESAWPDLAVVAIDEGTRELDRASIPIVRVLDRPFAPEDVIDAIRSALARRDPAVEAEAARAARAAEEAAKAAYEESFARDEQLYRWTKDRETEREEARRATPVAKAPVELLVRAFELSGSITSGSRFRRTRPDEAGAPSDRAFLERLDGGATLAEAAERAEISELRAKALGAIGLADGSLAPREDQGPDLSAWLRDHAQLDYFGILGVSRETGTDAAARAYRELRRSLDLEDPQGDRLKIEARRLLDEAFEVLSHPGLLAAYRGSL
jgi:hypothetical protein